ncbi:MAG: phosphonate C-P lyase system protein PhnH [Pseudomonadota bacterium]
MAKPQSTGVQYEGGFGEPAIEAARAFRAAMGAMARPGTIEIVSGASAPLPLSPAAATLVLVLCDPDTGISLHGALDREPIRQWIAFHTSAPLVAPADAVFAIGHWDDLQPLNRFAIGSSEYPDRSCTLIVERDALANEGAVLTGPGIKETARLNLPHAEAFTANRRLFPQGFDCFFTAAERVAALPRSTHVSFEAVATPDVEVV